MRVFAGPCVIENEVQALHVARHLAGAAGRLGVEIVYKSSFDKANRSSADSPAGPGWSAGWRSSPRSRPSPACAC